MKHNEKICIGPFYYYKGDIIIASVFQRMIDPALRIRDAVNIDAGAGEHRDMWDKHMLIHYPELKKDYNDNHKALPRGRVDLKKDFGALSFWITLDKCIPKDKEFEIKELFNITDYNVDFQYGVMNYHCQHCK